MIRRFIAFAALASFAIVPARASPVLGDHAACEAGATIPALLVWLDGLKDRKGKLRVELFPDNDKDFLEDDMVLEKQGKDFRRIEVPTPSSGPVAICIRAPHPGRFSFAMIHDREGRHKFSFSSDGAGFPGNPKLGWGKPKAAKAVVALSNRVTEIHVVMNYFHGLGFSPVTTGP